MFQLLEKEKTTETTGTFTVTRTGLFLPMQLTYKGKMTHCLSKRVNFPDGFDLAFTENHWSNEEKCI